MNYPKNLVLARLGWLSCLGLFLCLRAAAQGPAPSPAAAAALTPSQAAALVGGPTLITLHVSGATVPQVLDSVIQQAGLTAVDTTRLGAAGQQVTLDLERVPFWKAVPLIAAQTHVGFAENGSRSDQTLLQPSYGGADPMAGRVSAAGPFFVVAGSARRMSQGSVSFSDTGAGTSQGRQDLSILVSLLVDPKIHLVPDTTRISVLEATDENGKSLLSVTPSESGVNTDARYVIETGISLSTTATSRTVEHLRGILHVTMVKKSETWEIPALDTAAGAAKTLTTADGPAQLSVVSAQPQDRGYRVTVIYQGPTLGLAFRPASSLIFGSTRLTDSQGSSVTGFTGSVRGMGSSAEPTHKYTAEITYTPRGPNALTAPLKLTWSLPISLAQVDIPFEFTHLPLPQ